MHTDEKGRLILRTQLQIDISPNLKRAVKLLAIDKETSIKNIVLLGLEAKYPELKPYIKSDLEN